MIPCRRQALKKITVDQAEHAGLWFDKYLSQQLIKGESIATGQKTPQQRLVEECARVDTPDIYGAFFNRWRTALASQGARMKEAQVQGRLAVGLGDESVIEAAVTLHHTYGVPYIPGSALKGLASSFARQRLADAAWRQEGEAYQILFGNTEGAGFITFFDALYVPGSGHEGQALYPDVITVHHPDYYQQEGASPTDWDNPNPVSFLSATGSYLIALAGPPVWVDAAFSILELALAEAGVGAKTSSGYGRLYFPESSSTPTTASASGVELKPLPPGEAVSSTPTPQSDPDKPLHADEPIVQRFEEQLAALPSHRVAGEIHVFVERWRSSEIDESYRQRMARAIVRKIREVGREKKSRDKAWYQELLASLPEEH